MELTGPHTRKKWLILLPLLGVSTYGAYKVYNSPYIATKRKRLTNLFEGIASFAELITDSAITISSISRDLNRFLESDTDQVPNTFKQIAKLTKSKEFTDSISRISEAVTIGVLRGYNNVEVESDSGVVDRVLSSEAVTSFGSVVIGSFAKNLVLGLYEVDNSVETTTKPRWMSLLCDDDKCREVLVDCIERFTSSAVSVYIEKTARVNTYDQIFSGLTNPKHRDRARDVLVSVCNGALETFMRTSREVVFTSSNSQEETVRNGNGWGEVVTATLASPSNMKFMFDVTGRVTMETLRSILEFVVLKTSESFRRSFSKVHGEVADRGRQVVGYVGAKSSVIITLCLAVYLYVVNRLVRGSPVCLNQHF